MREIPDDAVSCREDDQRVDEGSTALVDVVDLSRSVDRRCGLEHGDHPGEFAVLGFVIFEVGDADVEAVGVPHSAS